MARFKVIFNPMIWRVISDCSLLPEKLPKATRPMVPSVARDQRPREPVAGFGATAVNAHNYQAQVVDRGHRWGLPG